MTLRGVFKQEGPEKLVDHIKDNRSSHLVLVLPVKNNGAGNLVVEVRVKESKKRKVSQED